MNNSDEEGFKGIASGYEKLRARRKISPLKYDTLENREKKGRRAK